MSDNFAHCMLPTMLPTEGNHPPLRMDFEFFLDESQSLALTTKQKYSTVADGRFDYAFLNSGVTLATNHTDSSHAGLAADHPVRLAGEVIFEAGELCYFNDRSGAYGRKDRAASVLTAPFAICQHLSLAKDPNYRSGLGETFTKRPKSVPSRPYCHRAGDIADIEDLAGLTIAKDGLPNNCPRSSCAFFYTPGLQHQQNISAAQTRRHFACCVHQ